MARRCPHVLCVGFALAFASALHADPAIFEARFHMERSVYPVYLPAGGSATGSGSIGVSTPTVASPIVLPQSGFGVTTGATLWSYPTYLSFYKTYATFVNDAGSFFAGGGPAAGMRTVSHPRSGTPGGAWVIYEGANGFGGTLGLLGKLGAHRQFSFLGTVFEGTSSWNMIRALGRSSMDPLNPYTNTNVFTGTPYGSRSRLTYTKFAVGTGWTTGTARVYVRTRSLLNTISYSRKGYDTAVVSPFGRRTRHIQLVTPNLTHWRQGSVDRESAHFGVLNLRIVPEPGAALLFAVGAGVLVGLHRVSRRG